MHTRTGLARAIKVVFAASLLLGALGSDAAPASAAPAKIIRLGHSEGIDTPHGVTMQLFKKLVETNSKGTLQVQVFPSLQLGPVLEELEGVKQGTQEMFISTPAWFNRYYLGVDVLSLPYLATDWDGAERLLAAPAIRKIAAEAEKASGIRILGVFPVGFRNAINRTRPIVKPADLAGLKIRVQNSPVYLSMFRALGANPVTLDPGEIFQAVQTGVIDGLETTLPIILSTKYYQVAPFISETRHNFDVFLVYMNQKFYANLTADEKRVVDDAMHATEAAGVVITKAAELTARATLLSAGAKVNDVSKETIQQLQQGVKPVYDQFGPKFEPILTELRSAVAAK